TFYFTDIYAVKDVAVAAKTDVETAKVTGDSVNLSEFFTSENELVYSLNYRGETIAIDGNEYEFPSNGTFEVTATPKNFNLRGEASVKFNVTDGFALAGNAVIKERTGESVSVSIGELNATFKEKDGVTPTVEGYKAYYGGEEVAVADGAFAATKDGAYAVEAAGRYEMNGKSYVSYQTLPVDVWSAENKYRVLNENEILYMSAYDTWDKHPTGTYGELTVDGKTITGVKSVSGGQSNTVYGQPFYSKNYYEYLVAQGANAKLMMNLYIADATSNNEKVRGLLWEYLKTTNLDTNEWHKVSIDLQKFVDEYDTVADTYARYVEIIAAGGRPRPGTDTGQDATGALFYLYGGHHARTVYFDLSVVYESETATVALKQDKTIELDKDNNLNELMDVTLDGETGVITYAEVYFNEAWVALENVTFDPVWAAEYQFRFEVETVDGSKYKALETSFAVGGEAFTATKDETLYTVKAGETFDVAKLLTGDYTFELETFASRGGNLTEVEIAEGTKISANALELGSYQIDVYAIKG
ncbi:MAG: hypothetical protein IJB97_08055, partial [Clostridia bacterium]|nr:hypothetical protein [Clostridia bacterium]